MKKIILFSLVGLLILLLGGCGLMPLATPGVEQPPEAPEGLEIGLEPAVDLGSLSQRVPQDTYPLIP